MGLLVPAQLHSVTTGCLRQETTPINRSHTLGPLTAQARQIARAALPDKRSRLDRASRPETNLNEHRLIDKALNHL